MELPKYCPKCGKMITVVAVGSNYITVGCTEHREFDSAIYDSVLNISVEDVWLLAEKENIAVPEDKKADVICTVKKYLEGYCFDGAYNIWDAIKDAIKNALE